MPAVQQIQGHSFSHLTHAQEANLRAVSTSLWPSLWGQATTCSMHIPGTAERGANVTVPTLLRETEAAAQAYDELARSVRS